jgi:hypothetical protein
MTRTIDLPSWLLLPTRYAIVAGVTVTGTISPNGERPGGFTGRITVRGRLATHRFKLPGT